MDAVLRQWAEAAPDVDTAHLGVVARLHRLAHQLRQRADTVLQPHGLTQGEFDVLSALRTAQADLREVISGMDDEDLGRPYSHFQPETEPYLPDPVVGWITGNTFEHVEDHLPALLAVREQVT